MPFRDRDQGRGLHHWAKCLMGNDLYLLVLHQLYFEVPYNYSDETA